MTFWQAAAVGSMTHAEVCFATIRHPPATRLPTPCGVPGMVDSWRQPNTLGSAALTQKWVAYDGLIALDAANLMELTNCSVAVPPRFSLRPQSEVTDVEPG